ncbi:hypothetical protein Cus16_1726 [Curtobacterium sp. ER1/6]|nr:hypothetical protein Cus16_1726 [Curtobacterium sp. ER1/6]
MGLHEQRRLRRVDAGRDVLRGGRPRARPELRRVLRRRDRVHVDHAVDRVVVVLQVAPLHERPDVVAEVEGPGRGLDAGEDARRGHGAVPVLRERRGSGSELVVDDHGSVVGPSLVVRRGAVDRVLRDLRGEVGRGHLVVDAPTAVVVERLAAPRPPRVGPVDVTGLVASDVHPAEARAGRAVRALDGFALGAEEPREVGTFAREEPGALDVALPVLDVPLVVPDVEVADDDRERVVRAQRRQPLGHRVEELPLLVLLRGVDLARVHVAGHDRDGGAVELVVGLDPASGGVEVRRTQFDAVDVRTVARGDRDTRAALRRGGVVHDVPLVAEEPGQVVARCADLLQGQHVDLARVEPVAHALPESGADAVHVDGCEAQACHADHPIDARGRASPNAGRTGGAVPAGTAPPVRQVVASRDRSAQAASWSVCRNSTRLSAVASASSPVTVRVTSSPFSMPRPRRARMLPALPVLSPLAIVTWWPDAVTVCTKRDAGRACRPDALATVTVRVASDMR